MKTLEELAKNTNVHVSADGINAVAMTLIVTAGACFIVDRVLKYKQICIATTKDPAISAD